MLDQRLAQVIQRVLATNDSRFPVNNSLNRLVNDFGIGTIRGKTVYFTDSDRSEMRSLLVSKGYSADQSDFSGLARHQRLSFSPNEKAGGDSIKKNRISIKALGSLPLLLAGQEMLLPDCSHLDVDWTEIAELVGHKCIMVVENYESFNLIHKTRFTFPAEFNSPLVLYRGDINESRMDNVLAFLRHMALPVLAFVDADPAGINIATQLPDLVGIVGPSVIDLEAQLKDGTARKDLFYNQYPVYGAMLDEMGKTHCCFLLWSLISKYKACVVQERWINDGTLCSILCK